MLYYNWDEYQSQVIDYPNNCIDVVPVIGYLHPCRLYFTPNDIYFSQPSLGVECCQLFAGVGPVPPTFLQGFNYTTTAVAPDMYGNFHQCNLWSGTGFQYWTDATTGHDGT